MSNLSVSQENVKEESIDEVVSMGDESAMDQSFASSAGSSKSPKKTKAPKAGTSGRTWTKLEDPNAPRKPRSAYVHFLSARRSHYGTVKQGSDQRSINIALAADWQALGEDDRAKYIEISAKEREEYQAAMAAYEKTDSHRDFIKKKEQILRQRKQSRKQGKDEGESFMEKLAMSMAESSPSKGGKGAGKKRKVKQEVTDYNYTVPTIVNTEIPVFSKEFLDYNKERESQLRLVRRAIGVAEDEQNSMKETMIRVDANCEALTSQQHEELATIAECEKTLSHWVHQVKTVLSKAGISGISSSPSDITAFLSGLSTKSDHDSTTARTALQSISFKVK